MRTIDDLNPTQVRILGALLEKEQATPDHYPLTVNALLAACNQKSNRDPVTSLAEGEVWDELEALRTETLVWRSDGARAQRWSQSISRRLELDPEEKALLTVLMLRGPQTVGELRSRSHRLHAFTSLAEIEAALVRMATEERDLVVELSRQPGQKENRWAQRLGGSAAESAPQAPAATIRPEAPDRDAHTADRQALGERVAALEEQVTELQAAVERLVRALDS
ncbi:MAG: YceH family protein [Acidobacteriota bacterium]|nr:YceH family protein [Acidobacteriota bacterium]